MSGNLNSNNIENDDYNLNTEEGDYKNLMARLKDISKNIFLLEKKYLNKF